LRNFFLFALQDQVVLRVRNKQVSGFCLLQVSARIQWKSAGNPDIDSILAAFPFIHFPPFFPEYTLPFTITFFNTCMENKIFPCLWFNGTGKAAAEFYCRAFTNARVISRQPIVTIFELNSQRFMALDGGPQYTANPSISFFVLYEDEAAMVREWELLAKGGQVMMPLDKYPWSEQYGWVQDSFGISWQLYLGKMEQVGQIYTPLLMFTGPQAGKAEEAMHFYLSIFPDSKPGGIARYEKGEGDVAGLVKHSQFHLSGQLFMAMDSSINHGFTFSEGISLVVECENQEEIDYYWNKLAEGGEESMCGWLKDRYGVSWQIVPKVLGQLMNDPERAQRVTQAFLKMKKFEIARLLNA
jgi:predicted 3-demethylubiquinone-9 3-methyltransferase (glyoxalase superfamily)